MIEITQAQIMKIQAAGYPTWVRATDSSRPVPPQLPEDAVCWARCAGHFYTERVSTSNRIRYCTSEVLIALIDSLGIATPE